MVKRGWYGLAERVVVERSQRFVGGMYGLHGVLRLGRLRCGDRGGNEVVVQMDGMRVGMRVGVRVGGGLGDVRM